MLSSLAVPLRAVDKGSGQFPHGPYRGELAVVCATADSPEQRFIVLIAESDCVDICACLPVRRLLPQARPSPGRCAVSGKILAMVVDQHARGPWWR